MSGKQTGASLTMQEGGKQNPVAGSELRQCCPNETDLGTQLGSLNLKLDEIASLVDQISREMGAFGGRNPRNADPDPGVSPTSRSENETAEPTLVYRLCALMDLLRKQYGFGDSGIFSRDAMTGRMETTAVSPHSGSANESLQFEEQVGILWESGDIQPAIQQQRRQTVAAPYGGRFLVVPLETGDKRSWFWVMHFQESVIPESLSAADLVLWTEILHCCVEWSGPNKASASSREDGSSRMDRERIYSTAQLGRALTHEINNPLQVIMGRTQLLKMNLKKSGGQPNDKILDIIEASAGKICSLVKDFSDHLHRQSAQVSDGEEVNLLHILESDLPLIAYLLSSRRIKLETDLRGPLPSVSGNPGELETAVLLLIWELEERLAAGGTASLRASVDEGNVRLDLRGLTKDAATPSPKDAEDATTVDRLKMASGIVERFGGGLEIRSHTDDEVSFSLTLPGVFTGSEDRRPSVESVAPGPAIT